MTSYEITNKTSDAEELEYQAEKASLDRTEKVLAGLGFEHLSGEEGFDFIAKVNDLARAGNREGLITAIAGGATYAEAAESADQILEALSE